MDVRHGVWEVTRKKESEAKVGFSHFCPMLCSPWRSGGEHGRLWCSLSPASRGSKMPRVGANAGLTPCWFCAPVARRGPRHRPTGRSNPGPGPPGGVVRSALTLWDSHLCGSSWTSLVLPPGSRDRCSWAAPGGWPGKQSTRGPILGRAPRL